MAKSKKRNKNRQVSSEQAESVQSEQTQENTASEVVVAEEEQEVNVAELEPEISDAEETPEPEEDPVVEKPAPAAPQEEQKITLQDAAQRYVVGYQNSWWPSMSAYARNVSLPSLLTISEAKRFLKTWGAALRD